MTGTDPYRWVHGSGGVALIQYSCAQALSLPLNAKKHAQKNLQIIDRRDQKQNLHFWFSVGRAEILSANTRSFGGKTAGKKTPTKRIQVPSSVDQTCEDVVCVRMCVNLTQPPDSEALWKCRDHHEKGSQRDAQGQLLCTAPNQPTDCRRSYLPC